LQCKKKNKRELGAQMFPYIKVAALNLTLQKRRTLLLGTAVAAVTFLLLLLLSFVGGVTRSLTEAALTISSGHVNVAGFYKIRSDRAQAAVTKSDQVMDVIKKTVPDIDHILDRGRGWGRVVSPASSLNTSLIGIQSTDLGKMTSLRIQTPNPDLTLFDSGSGAILFAAQAERLQVKVGESVTFITEGNGSETNTTDLVVVALAADLGFLSNFSIIVNKKTIKELYRFQDDTTGGIHIYLKHPRKAPETMVALSGALEKAGFSMLDHEPKPFFMKFRRIVSEDWKGQKLDLTVWEDEVSFLYWIVTSLNALSVFLIWVLGIIISVGIANTTWMSVRERTREMGTLRAIGMQTPQVLTLFLAEAVLLGLASSTVGALVGALAATALDQARIPIGSSDLQAFLMSDTLRFALSGWQIGSAIVVIASLTGCAAAFPAWRASKLNPVVALGHAS
jgi:putative ABC transport system permease protein